MISDCHHHYISKSHVCIVASKKPPKHIISRKHEKTLFGNDSLFRVRPDSFFRAQSYLDDASRSVMHHQLAKCGRFGQSDNIGPGLPRLGPAVAIRARFRGHAEAARKSCARLSAVGCQRDQRRW